MEPEKADSLASELREKWAAMTKAEKHEITKDAVEALNDRKENVQQLEIPGCPISPAAPISPKHRCDMSQTADSSAAA